MNVEDMEFSGFIENQIVELKNSMLNQDDISGDVEYMDGVAECVNIGAMTGEMFKKSFKNNTFSLLYEICQDLLFISKSK